MPGSRPPLILLAILLMLAGCTSKDSQPKADCLINDGPCTKTSDRGSVTLRISPRPVRGMQELSVSVTLIDMDTPEIIILELSMPGMNMGINNFDMKRLGGGLYSAAAVIPRCPSGQSLWRAALIDMSGNELAVYYMEVN